MWAVENIRINKKVLDKIKVEEQKHPHKEFGGFLIIKNNGYVKDIIFDMQSQSATNVNLGSSKIIKLSHRHRKMVKGWFHKHPINGLSSTDKNTIKKLTNFWGVCYTMVLQANGQILLLKTVKGKEFRNIPVTFSRLKFWKKQSDQLKDKETEKNEKTSIDKELIVEVFRKEIPFGIFKPKESIEKDNK